MTGGGAKSPRFAVAFLLSLRMQDHIFEWKYYVPIVVNGQTMPARPRRIKEGPAMYMPSATDIGQLVVLMSVPVREG